MSAKRDACAAKPRRPRPKGFDGSVRATVKKQASRSVCSTSRARLSGCGPLQRSWRRGGGRGERGRWRLFPGALDLSGTASPALTLKRSLRALALGVVDQEGSCAPALIGWLRSGSAGASYRRRDVAPGPPRGWSAWPCPSWRRRLPSCPSSSCRRPRLLLLRPSSCRPSCRFSTFSSFLSVSRLFSRLCRRRLPRRHPCRSASCRRRLRRASRRRGARRTCWGRTTSAWVPALNSFTLYGGRASCVKLSVTSMRVVARLADAMRAVLPIALDRVGVFSSQAKPSICTSAPGGSEAIWIARLAARKLGPPPPLPVAGMDAVSNRGGDQR